MGKRPAVVRDHVRTDSRRTACDVTRPATVVAMQTQKSSPLLPAAVILVVIGFVASIALLVPAVRDTNQAVVVTVYLLALCAPVGLLLAVVFALMSGRRSR